MASSRVFQNSKRILDFLEQVLVLALYVWLIARLWPNQLSPTNWYPLLILLSEGLVVVLLVIRRQADCISMDFRDWAVAFAGTFLVLFVGRGGPPLSGAGGALLMLIGLAIHVGAKFSLLRSFGLVAADRGVKRRGLYAVVRHPMYAGYMLTHIGYLLVAPSWWNLAIYSAAWALFIARIFAEERVLSGNPQYRSYMDGVRHRLLPSVF